MPPRKRQQSSAMLYTLVVFIGLFIIATTFAVVYYVKAEEFRSRAAEMESQINDLASSTERQRLGSIIGAKQPRQSWLATLLTHYDNTFALVTGAVPQDTSTEVKLANAIQAVRDVLKLTADYIDTTNVDPNTVGLVRIITTLKTQLDNANDAQASLKQQLTDLQQKFDDALAATIEKEKVLQAEKDRLQQRVNEIARDYNDLKILLEQTTDQRVQTLLARLDQQRNQNKQLNQQLLQTQAQLQMTQQMLKKAQQQLASIKPPPDANATAYKVDGKIILIDAQNKVVHINIGADDHVYRGLTFSVYDRHGSIPKDGKPKAQIEVFDVAKNYSAARIISEDRRRPILEGDVIANLIWDSDKQNTFVIAGDFDLNQDGNIDPDAYDRLVALIKKWGGTVAETITVDTDYLILGKQPRTLRKPTPEEMELDPQAMAKYQAAQTRLEHYNQSKQLAEALWIPILRYERFLYFIGYKALASRAGAF